MKRLFATILLCAFVLGGLFGTQAELNNKFTAGIYTATVDGHNGPLTVETVFSDQAITCVTVKSHAETAGISDSAIENIPALIADLQTLDIDTISGATISSQAILDAVADCVVKAGAKLEEMKKADEVIYEKNLTAGTYQATAHGHHSDITVETVVTSDAIESVKIIEAWETYNLGDAAIDTIPAAIVEHQSTGIDSVTGATYTSRAILSAVEDCLKQAGGVEAVRAFSKRIESEPWSTEQITEDYDVVVVGSGLSGVCAAMAAQDAGAKVVLIEKLPYWGGTSQAAAGYLAHTNDEGKNTEDVYNYLMQRYVGTRQGDTYMGGKYPLPAAVQVLAENSYQDIRWLETKGVSFNSFTVATNRYGEVQEDGTVKTKQASFDFSQYAEEERDPNIAAMAMERMIDHFQKNGGVLYLNTTAEELLTNEENAVVGIKATGKGGKYTFNAKSVVLCTGGFGASPEMIAELAPAYIGERNITLPGNTGDGIRMAREVGAALFDDQFMMSGSGHTLLTDEAMIAEYKDVETPKSSLYVNPNGMRINSEDPETYSNSTLHTNPDSRDYYWIIINEENAAANEVYRYIHKPETLLGTYKDMLEKELAAGNERFFKADSLADLAKQMKIVPSTLMYTMNRYNQLCKKGEDTDLFKRADYLIAMEKGPWYAVKAYVSYFGTVGGVVTDETTAVLKADGTPIKGLYAAGETSNHNVFNNAYAGAWSLSECLVFGRLAGTNAAQFALK